MKKINLFVLLLSISLFFSCENEKYSDDLQDETANAVVDDEEAPKRSCGSALKKEIQLRENPGMAKVLADLEIESQKTAYTDFNTPEKAKTIKVVVHVLYNKKDQNISDSQIKSQLTVLNKDYAGNNSDLSKTPREFKGKIGKSGIRFKLAKTIRKKTKVKKWGFNDKMKFHSKGGSPAYKPKKFLNIWVCNLEKNTLGFATFPGGKANIDGVVIGYKQFGTWGTAKHPYNKGRTTTHEVGHWLNLNHIWGDGGCNKDDRVSDTPKSNKPHYGSPTHPKKRCGSNDMFMNFMDYVDDRVMVMFTKGQTARMRATLKGPRSSY